MDTGDDAGLPAPVASRVEGFLGDLDALLPQRVAQAHLFGSVALGAFRDGRSDIDVLVVLDGPLASTDLDRVRRCHRRTFRREAARALPRGRNPLLCNASYVTVEDLALAPGVIEPQASHAGWLFRVGAAFDVNPVVWHELATRGVTLRGPKATTLGLVDDDAELRRWNRHNLEAYWRPWATAVRGSGPAGLIGRTAHWSLAWGVLGAPRLHCTIATGEVITKEGAGRYSLEAFDDRWHPLIRAALDHWSGTRSVLAPAGARRLEAADFVEMVVDDVAIEPD